MHLIVPFAAPASPACREALASLATPALDGWLAQASRSARDDCGADSFHPPHERALARALGWPLDGDAPLPWAARAARADGVEVGDAAWGLLTPVHWRVGAEAVHVADPAALALDAAESRTLFDAVRPLFDSEGFTLAWGAPLRWYAAHPLFAALGTASLDRAIGHGVERWLPVRAQPPLLRRLLSEVQMLLHAHPLNVAREDAGLPVVNAFWLSGCGAWRPEAPNRAPNDAQLDERLRASAFADDAAAWRDAWAALDAALGCSPALQRLTLCGERASATFEPSARSWTQRLAQPFQRRAPAHDLLATL